MIGFGGGSSLDVAKLVALLAARAARTLADIYGVGNAKGPRLPLLAIPTTAGTGSEVTPISIVTTGAHEKKRRRLAAHPAGHRRSSIPI